ncbi:hypothetical protein Gotri_010461, partial [Gossypium trilobum]|nr:hypothetical protein [Gossypium trilobum]
MGMLVLSVFVSVLGYQKEEPIVVGMKGHNPPHDKHKQPVKVKQQHHQRILFKQEGSSKRFRSTSQPLKLILINSVYVNACDFVM